jgi:hypothetical protein
MLSKTKQKITANQLLAKGIDCIGNFSQGAETPGTRRDIAFSQLAVEVLKYRNNNDSSKNI